MIGHIEIQEAYFELIERAPVPHPYRVTLEILSLTRFVKSGRKHLPSKKGRARSKSTWYTKQW